MEYLSIFRNLFAKLSHLVDFRENQILKIFIFMHLFDIQSQRSSQGFSNNTIDFKDMIIEEFSNQCSVWRFGQKLLWHSFEQLPKNFKDTFSMFRQFGELLKILQHLREVILSILGSKPNNILENNSSSSMCKFSPQFDSETEIN